MPPSWHAARRLIPAIAALLSLGGCATWTDHPGGSGAGLPDERVAVFMASGLVAEVESLDRHAIEFSRAVEPDAPNAATVGQYALASDIGLRRVRLLPGRYRVTTYGSYWLWQDTFDVMFEGGHTYGVDYETCSFTCRPYRTTTWIKDMGSGERISEVHTGCIEKRWGPRVPCP